MSKVPVRPRPAKSVRRGRAPQLVRVPFHDEQLEAVRDDGRVMVSIRRVCDVLGVRMTGQLAKLRVKPWAVVQMICTTGPDGKTYEAACIELDALPMWLATIEPGRVKPELRDKLVVYQREAARVLRDHFFGAKPQEPARAPPPLPLPLPAPTSTTAGALDRLDSAEKALGYVEQDLSILGRCNPGSPKPEALTGPINTGLSWARDGLKSAFYALDDPIVMERWSAVRARWTHLAEIFSSLM